MVVLSLLRQSGVGHSGIEGCFVGLVDGIELHRNERPSWCDKLKDDVIICFKVVQYQPESTVKMMLCVYACGSTI